MKAVGKLLFPALGMLVMILDAKTALSAAEEAIALCLKVVVPSLFPFLVLASYLNSGLQGRQIPFGKWIARFTGIPEGSEGTLFTGLLGGYPSGAKAVEEGKRNGWLTDWEAERMLAFCNNAGPAFIFGLGSSLFSEIWMAWALWGIHIASALLVGHLLPGKSSRRVTLQKKTSQSFPAAVASGVKTMALVCGWVVLFRILIGFLDRWALWALPNTVKTLVAGVLELTNGCCMLSGISPIAWRFVLCAGMLGFGGLCVSMQTLSVAETVSTRLYFPGKCLQSLVSLSFAIFIMGRSLPGWTLALPAGMLISILFLAFREKRSSNPASVRV